MGETDRRTQEERTAQAAAPEEAIRKVQQFARLPMDRVFHGSRDLELMEELIGPYLDDANDGPRDYAGFCRCLYHAFLDGTTPIPERNAEDGIPFLGAQVSNAAVLLGLMLLDHARGRGQSGEVCLCTQMTLGQYLEALDALVFSKGVALGPGFRNWRKSFLKSRSPDSPLADVLAALLKRYILGWKRFDAMHHILCCMEALTRELERAPEPRRQDLSEHYFKQALAYSWDLPDPAKEGGGDVREQIFLPKRDFTLQTLMLQTAAAPTQPFQKLFARILKERWQFDASPLINAAVTDLLMLFVGPYLYMEGGGSR